MASVQRVRRLVNGSKRNPRRKLYSAKQISFFGTKRQKAALRRKKGSSVSSTRKKNARVSKLSRTAKKKTSVKRSVKRNPAPFLITLGAVNPRRKSMAKRRKKSGVRSRRRRPAVPTMMNRRRNSRRRSYSRRRVANPRRRSYSRRRRNPEAFGLKATSGKFVQAVMGGLIGVAATKFIPTLIPMGLVGSNNLMRFVVSVGSAFVAGMVASKVASGPISDGVLFGGLMQAASVGMNTFLPAGPARALALNGMGEFVGSRFVVPQNPIAQIPAPAARVQASGLARSFGTAF